jgi:hypothetical protein
MGRFDAAMIAYGRALALDPNLAEARGNRGCLQLLLGDFAQGWEGYEHRWADGERPTPICPRVPTPSSIRRRSWPNWTLSSVATPPPPISRARWAGRSGWRCAMSRNGAG